jgi:E3 ubiquitin-protein ligase HUWE1
MGRIPEKGKDKADDRLASLDSEASDDEHIDEAVDREETPDLYRNSALGM